MRKKEAILEKKTKKRQEEKEKLFILPRKSPKYILKFHKKLLSEAIWPQNSQSV